jgi:hypothetical protein
VIRGTAHLELSGDRRLDLREDSRVRVGAVPGLLAGDLLVTAAGDEDVVVEADRTRVRLGDGAARLSRSLALTVAVYQGGGAGLDSVGRELTVPALRQAVVPAPGLLPLRPSPLRYEERDAWDRRFLGEAIDLGRELVAKSRGFTGQLRAGEGRTAGFYRLLLPALEDEASFGPALVDVELEDTGRSPGELLVGAAIAVAGEKGTFAPRWEAVFAFRDAGAEWGLVALDQDVDRSPLVAAVDAAIGRASGGFVLGTPGGTPAGPSPTTTTGPEPSPPGPGPSPATTTTVPPTTTTTTPPPVTLPPVDPVVDVVDDIVGSLIP